MTLGKADDGDQRRRDCPRAVNWQSCRVELKADRKTYRSREECRSLVGRRAIALACITGGSSASSAKPKRANQSRRGRRAGLGWHD
ncbi:hypothetical protein VTN96DRAFT_553 [Rasamsonia emersonii]